jgi:hypothetical protein
MKAFVYRVLALAALIALTSGLRFLPQSGAAMVFPIKAHPAIEQRVLDPHDVLGG